MFKVIYFFIVTVLGWNMTQTCSWQVSSHFVTPGWLMLLELLSVWFNELLYLYSELFYKDKTVLSPRDTLRFPQLAETMETISKEGADAFYTGKIARHLIQDVQERSMNCLYINAVAVIRTDVVLSKQIFGTCACLHCFLLFFPDGILSLDDLHTFQVRVNDSWSVQLGDYTMHFPPPPAGGAILSFILKLMHGSRSQKTINFACNTEAVLIHIKPPFDFLRIQAFSSL